MHPCEIQDQGFLARMTQCSPGHISIQGQEERYRWPLQWMGLPRPQTQASIPISLSPVQQLEEGLPRPLIPRPKAVAPSRSRSPLPFVPDNRSPKTFQAAADSGRRHGAKSSQQRTQSNLLRTRTPSANPQLMGMWLQLLHWAHCLRFSWTSRRAPIRTNWQVW